MSKHTATTIAWLSKYSLRDFAEAQRTGDSAAIVNSMHFSPNESMGKGKDAWTRVGSATVTVELEDKDKLVGNAVKALRAQQKAVRAEAEVQATSIERQIQQLMAITYEPEAV